MGRRFNTPPGWPPPPSAEWLPPPGWAPDPSWPTAPPGWSFYSSSTHFPQTASNAKAELSLYRDGHPHASLDAYRWRQPPGQPGPVPPVVQRSVVVVGGFKSTPLAVLLGFFFGPLGLLYSTVTGAVVMFFVNLVVFFLTFGFGLFLTWPISALWGGIAASTHNSRLKALGASRW